MTNKKEKKGLLQYCRKHSWILEYTIIGVIMLAIGIWIGYNSASAEGIKIGSILWRTT